jgi:hypothetical protein
MLVIPRLLAIVHDIFDDRRARQFSAPVFGISVWYNPAESSPDPDHNG